MRIPSELHGESLYGRKSGGRSSTQSGYHRSPPKGDSWRRVFRLSLVLVLVVIAMRQAAHPGVYQVFFPEPPRPMVGEASARPNVVAALPRENASGGNPASPLLMTQEERKQFDAWADSLSSNELAQTLANWLAGDAVVVDQADRDVRLTPGMAVLIQRRLILASTDGSVWRAADGSGLSASLAMHNSAAPRFESLLRAWPQPSVAGVLPLLQQPEVYRGRSLIAAGELVQIEKVVLAENVFGVRDCFHLWLLPHDDRQRPWMVIVPELLGEMQGLLSTSNTAGEPADKSTTINRPAKQAFSIAVPRPSISVQGEYLKRWSYQSKAGAELTPVVVGHVRTLRPNGNPLLSGLSSSGQNGSTRASGAQRQEVPIVWVLVGSGVIGLLLASAIMWRTAVQHRHLRQRRASRKVTLGFLIALGSTCAGGPLFAQSLTDLLPGFDSQRMQTLTADAGMSLESPNINIDEVAKLVFRIDRLSNPTLVDRLDRSASPAVVGDAVEICGTILSAKPLTVSTELQEYLEIDRVAMILVEPQESSEELSGDVAPQIVFAIGLPDDAAAGDRVSGIGVRLRTSAGAPQAANDFVIDVAGRLKWAPAEAGSPAEEVLSAAGVDLSRLAEIASLDRMPLTQADSAVFYPMIGAARAVSPGASDPATDAMREEAMRVSSVDLLRNPDAYTGKWITLDVETVRITRVAVQSPQRREEVGGDSYFEIDAIGDLGNVELLLDVADGDPVRIENRYPVTIISPTLPKFLRGGDSANAIVINRKTPIRVEGFFYRLWGYESDLMEARGGKQFAPLIIAGIVADRSAVGSDPLQVAVLGKIAAVGVVTAILATIAYLWLGRRGDRESRRRRFSDREPSA